MNASNIQSQEKNEWWVFIAIVNSHLMNDSNILNKIITQLLCMLVNNNDLFLRMLILSGVQVIFH